VTPPAPQMVPLATFVYVEGSLADGDIRDTHVIGSVHGRMHPEAAAVILSATDDQTTASRWAAALRQGRWPR
jgi:hypothetical protein